MWCSSKETQWFLVILWHDPKNPILFYKTIENCSFFDQNCLDVPHSPDQDALILGVELWPHTKLLPTLLLCEYCWCICPHSAQQHIWRTFAPHSVSWIFFFPPTEVSERVWYMYGLWNSVIGFPESCWQSLPRAPNPQSAVRSSTMLLQLNRK